MILSRKGYLECGGKYLKNWIFFISVHHSSYAINISKDDFVQRLQGWTCQRPITTGSSSATTKLSG
jgi:hypothetical protein